MKRILAVLLVVILALSIGACTSKQNQVIEEKPLIVLVTDVGGLGDQSIHDVAWAGCEKAESKYDIEIRCLESESADEYVKNVELAVNDGATLTICVGENFTETIKTMGEKYPKNNFLLLDGVVDLPNVSSVVFKGEEGGFLAGVVAAEKSQTKKVGFVGGQDLPVIDSFRYGFLAGVQSVDPTIQVMEEYVGTFEDREAGKAAAIKMADEGVDVLFQAAGVSGIGAIEGAAEKGIQSIGVDQDQSALAPQNVLCSVEKKVDVPIFDQIKLVLKDKFKGGVINYDLENGGLAIADKAGNLSKETNDSIKKWTKAIVKDKFVVPANSETFQSFVVPEV